MSYLKTHYQNRKQSRYPAQLARYMVKKFGLTQFSSIAEFGCGPAAYLTAIMPYVGPVTGYDLEPAFPWVTRLDLSKPHAWRPEYDMVYSKSVLEHLLYPTQFLLNMKAACRPGGLIVVMVPDWRTCFDTFYDDYTHVKPYTQESLKHQMEVVLGTTVECEVLWQMEAAWRWPFAMKMLRLMVPRALADKWDWGRRLHRAALIAWTRNDHQNSVGR